MENRPHPSDSYEVSFLVQELDALLILLGKNPIDAYYNDNSHIFDFVPQNLGNDEDKLKYVNDRLPIPLQINKNLRIVEVVHQIKALFPQWPLSRYN